MAKFSLAAILNFSVSWCGAGTQKYQGSENGSGIVGKFWEDPTALIKDTSSSEDFSVPDLPEFSWSCKSSPSHEKVSRRGCTGRVKMYQKD